MAEFDFTTHTKANADGPSAQTLQGCRIGITAERKAEEFAAGLKRRGAHVSLAPALHTIPLVDDEALLQATRHVVVSRVDYVVVITGAGFRGWLEAASAHGLRDALVAQLGRAQLVARGAKAKGAIRGAGLVETWTAPSEESSEVLQYLLSQDLAGQRVVVQVHGEPMAEFRRQLTDAGAEAVPVVTYRWTAPVDPAPLDQLIHDVIAGQIDALPMTSAVASANLLRRAEELGLYKEFRDSLGDGSHERSAKEEAVRPHTLVACVGPVTAEPFAAAGIPYAQSERARTASLIRLLEERCGGHSSRG